MYRSVNRKILPNYPFELDFFYTIEYLRQGKGKIISDVLAEYRANSSTSISVSGFKMCQKLRIEYYKNLLKEDFTRWKNDVFVCAAYKFLSYIRNPNRIAWDWLKLAFLSFTFNGLYSFLEYYQQIKTQAKRFKCI